MAAQIKSDLSLLEQKIKKLMEVNLSLHKALGASLSDNQRLNEELRRKEEELINFHNRYKIAKIVGHVAVDGNTTELKSKINEYIKEIDKCITHLST